MQTDRQTDRHKSIQHAAHSHTEISKCEIHAGQLAHYYVYTTVKFNLCIKCYGAKGR